MHHDTPYETIPLSLGIATIGGGVTPLLRRGRPLPARATEIFTTFLSGETTVTVHLLTGERALASDCLEVGQLSLRVRPQAAGQARIGLQLAVDASGLLKATVTDLRTGASATDSTQPWAALDAGALATLLADAEARAGDDARLRRLIDLRNEATAVLAGIEAALPQPEAQALADGERHQLHLALDQVQSLLVADDVPALEGALARLNEAAVPLVARLQGSG